MSAGNPEALPRHAATSRELLLVGLFSLLAAVRVFVFTAAFPFFSHVDEHHHFDLACRYSHGDVPRGLETFSAEASALAVFCQPGIPSTAGRFADGVNGPAAVGHSGGQAQRLRAVDLRGTRLQVGRGTPAPAAGATGDTGGCPMTEGFLQSKWLGRRIGQRRGATRAPSQGPRPEPGPGIHSALLPFFSLRDWQKSDKPSRHDAATFSTECPLQFASAKRPQFQFPLNQDTIIAATGDEIPSK